MQPIIQLFNTLQNKDIDQNFIDTLEALMFLSPIKKEDFNKEIKFEKILSQFNDDEFNYDDEPINLGTLLKTNPVVAKKQPSVQIYSQTPVDILINKLSDNLRRMYAFYKSEQTKTQPKTPSSWSSGYSQSSIKSKIPKTYNENNLSTLKEQQNLIYKVLTMIDPLMELTHKKKPFNRAILGQNVNASSLELFGYLSLHEHLSNENADIHHQLLNKHICPESFTGTILNPLSCLIHQTKNIDKLHLILKNTNLNTILHHTFLEPSSNIKESWVLLTTDYLLQNNLIEKLDIETKSLILKKLLVNNRLDTDYFNQFVQDRKFFIDSLNDIYRNKDFIHVFTSDSVINNFRVENIRTSNTASFLFDKIEHFNIQNEKILIRTIINSIAHESDKEKIYSLFDFNDISFLTKIASNLHNNSKFGQAENHILNFVNAKNNASNKELLAHILSLDTRYIQSLKEIFLKLKLSETLSKKSSEPIKVKKI